jgi:AraC-like DNA-binding protein
MFEAEAHQRSDAFIQEIDKATSPESVLEMNAQLIRDWTQAIHEAQHRRQLSPAIRKCQEYIYENLHANIKLDELARLCGLSAPYLASRFKNEVGQTITAYTLGLKIKTAENLLLTSRRTSKNIAFLLNFSSQSYFIRCFKRVTGMTPQAFRKYASQTIV